LAATIHKWRTFTPPGTRTESELLGWHYELGKLELYRMHLEPALDAAKTAESLAPSNPRFTGFSSLIISARKDYQAASPIWTLTSVSI